MQQKKAIHKKTKYKQETETIKKINIVLRLLENPMNVYVTI